LKIPRGGSGTFDFESENARYFGVKAIELSNEAGIVSPINDYPDNADVILTLSYTHTLPGEMSWLSLSAGQFSLTSIDGTPYTTDPHGSLINMSFSASASAAYPDAGFGAYAKTETGHLSVRAGAQSSANMEGNRIAADTISGGYYTSFLFTEYKPEVKNFGEGIYSFLLYYQNNEGGLSDTFGWSFNFQQAIGKFAVYGKANGIKGGISESGIKQGYATGIAYKDPFERNDLDVILLAAGYNEIDAEEFGFSSEKILEFQWVYGITYLMSITPNIQIYDSAFDNGKTSVVYGLRATFYL